MTTSARTYTTLRDTIVVVRSKPVFPSLEHDLDPVAAFVMLDEVDTRRPTRIAGVYLLVFRLISESVGIIAAMPKIPPLAGCLEEPPRWCRGSLSCRHEKADSMTVGICDGMQFGDHTILNPTKYGNPL